MGRGGKKGGSRARGKVGDIPSKERAKEKKERRHTGKKERKRSTHADRERKRSCTPCRGKQGDRGKEEGTDSGPRLPRTTQQLAVSQWSSSGLRASRRNEFFSVCRREDYFTSYSFAARHAPLSLSLSLSLCTKTFSSPRSVSFGASCAVCCRRRKVIILRSLPARRRDERWRNTGRERGPTWKLISNEPRVKSKLIRFRLAGAALTNQVFLERETFRRVSAIIRRTPRKRTQGSEEGCASHEFSLDSERWWHSLHDKR